MICRIDTSTEEGKKALKDIRMMVAGDLNDMATAKDKPKFVLEDYLKSIYDFVHENTMADVDGKHGMALSYAGLAADAINKIQGADETIADYLFEQNLSLDKLREFSYLYKKGGDAELKSFSDKIGVKENEADDLNEDNQSSLNSTTNTESTSTLGPVEIDQEELPPADLSQQVQKTFNRFLAAKPTVNSDQDQEVINWTDPNNINYNVKDPLKEFYFKVKRFLLSKILSPAMDNDSSNVNIPYLNKKGVYLTLMPIKSLPRDQVSKDAGTDTYNNDDLVLVVTDVDGNPLSFDDKGEFSKDGNISYHYYRKIYPQQVDAEGRVSLYKAKSSNVIDDYDRADALKRRSKLTLEQAQEAIRQELQMIYDINKAYKKNPDLRLRSKITGGSFGFIETNSNIYTPISEMNFDYGEFAPRVATMDNSITKEKKGYTYFETKESSPAKIEVIKPTIPSIEGLQDKIVSILLDRLPIFTSFGISKNISNADRLRYLKNYVNLQGTGIQFFDDAKDGSYKVKLRGNTIYKSLPTLEFDKESNSWVEKTTDYLPAAVEQDNKNQEEARRILNEYFSTLAPQIELDPANLNLEQKSKAIQGTDPFDPETSSKFKPFSLFYNTETKKYWRISYPIVNINAKALDSNQFFDVDVETKDGVLQFVEKEKSYVDFVKQNSFIHHPLNSNKRIDSFNAYYVFDYLPEDLDKVFKKPAVEKKPVIKEPEQTSKSVADQNNLKGIDSILDNPDFNKLMDQKNMNRKVVEEKLKEALDWWNNSPLSKTGIKLNVLFDMVNSSNPKSIANMTLHSINLYKGADYSDLYHEAFHYFTQTFLTEEQRTKLYAEAGSLPGSFTDFKGKTVLFADANEKQLEEYLAEDFREYMLSNGKKAITDAPVKKSIFRKILDFLNVLFGDKSLSTIDAENNAIQSIHDIYDKLRLGNLNEYNFSMKNAPASFSVLDKGVSALDENEPISNLSFEDSKRAVDMVDSLLSKFIDDFSEIKRNRGFDSYKWTKTLLQNKDGLKAGYQQVLLDIVAIRNGLQSDLNNLNEKISGMSEEEAAAENINKQRLENQINFFDWTIKNFGDTENLMNNRPVKNEEPKGLIAYHQMKSKIIAKEYKEAFFAEDAVKEEDLFLKGREGFDRLGNEASMKELASEEILFILHGLHKKDITGKYTYVEGTETEVTDKDGKKKIIGVPELQDFDVTWNILVKTLQNTMSAESMQSKLVKLKEKRPELPITQLLNKIGPLSTKGVDEFNIWTNFYQTFNKTNVPLLQTTIELTTKDLNGKSLSFENYGYTIKAVPATGDVNAIKSMWDSNFQTLSTPTKFIKKDGFGINYLDLAAVIKEFKDKLQGREIEFLNAIGIQLDDNEEMRSALNNIKKPVNAIFKAIEILNTNKNYRRKVTKPSFFAKKHFDLDDDGNIKVQKITYKGKEIDKNVELLSGESKNLNTIADLQAKYSEKWGNFQRTNAEGNTQFEHSLNSSLSIMVNAINDARSYRELISAPWMKHLDINRNFNAKASWWLKSIFDMDDYMKGGDGAKFPDKSTKSGLVELYLKNLSGVAFNKDGVFDEDKGIASASADTTTKMIMDMHMVLLNGASELMRHADKGTSYGVFLSSIKKPYVEEKNTYVSTIDFLKSEGEFSRGDLIAFQNSVLPSLAAELSRIQDFRSKQEQIDDAKKKGLPSPVQNIDFNYFKRGQAFVTFRDMLTPEMKIKLIKEVKGDLLTYLKSNPQLEKELRLNLKQYFDKETDRIIKDLIKIGSKNKRGNIISDNVFDNLQKKIQENQLNVDPKSNAAKKALVRTYVVNTWIHNMESINLIYGDTALYNMAKEEFHKRNAGVSSTGTIYRTDKDALDYVNTVLKRGYLSEEGIEDKYGPFNGTMNTAVVKDNEIPSKYIKIYAEALIKDLKDRNKISDLEARKQILGYDEKTNEVGTYDKLYKNGKLHAYYKMNEGDAQGWITLDSYRILLNLEGQWSKSQENLYQKIIKKEPVLEKDVIETFPPQKLQYWGPLNTEGLPVNAFHKFSLLPLVPNVIKDTSLEDLHNKMVKEGVDYALFQSGSKVGTITKDGEYDKLYSDDNRTISSEPFTKNSIFLNYLKNQLNIAPKYKNKVTFSTQLRKLIENGLIENGVPTDFKGTREQWDDIKSEAERKRKSKNYTIYKKYEDNLKLLTKQKKEELLEEMDWKMVSGVPKGSIEDLVKFVRKELTREDLAQHEIDFVDLASGGKKLKHDLSMSSSANKIEKLLNSIVTNRLIKQKINGEGLIQISGAGFETKNAWLDARSATEEELKKWGTNDLPTYYKKADGTTAAMKVKVALQGNFKKLLNLKDVNDLAKERQIPKIDALNILIKDEKWLDKEDNRKLLTMVGVRIPVQGINSAEFMEVYEFLPENAGNIIVPPAEIVAKSGSDFDIDKLTVMMPNIGVYNNEVKLIKFDPKNKRTKKDIQESLNEAYENKLNIKIMYEEWFKEDKESKAFKVLTEEEKALIEKLKQEYGSRLKEINDQLNPLKYSWEKLRREQGAKYYTSSEFLEIEEQIINLTAQKESLFKDFSDNKEFYKSTFYSDKVRQLREKEEQDIQKANEEIAKLKEELDATSTKGIENDLLFNIKEMLELPSNFVALITPNSTDIAQPIADDLSYFVNQYNQKDNLMGTASKEQLDFLKEDPSVMSGTRVLEVGYNLFKHANNNIGKAVLGIGAVDNTMNAIFNRVGAYMNPTAIVRYSNNKKTTKVRQTILADHNKMMVDGKECISLSDLYDYNKENSISDVISQLINGWVDVAKDAWIFNLQGNREITPTLLFMVQAGVPLRTAVYMVSQPIIREYVEEQRLRQSTFSPIMGNESKSRGFIQFDAKKKMLEKYFPEKFILSDEAKEEAYNKNGSEGIEIATNALFSKPRIQEFTVDETDRAFRDNNNKMNPSTLYKNIVDYKEDPNKEISDYEKAVLLHYFELEDMAKAVKDVKKAMNFDTSKDSNIFEAQNRTAIIAKLKENDRIPTDIVDKILENSPISSFYISEFQTQIWEPLFKLRNHEVFNQFIIDKMGNQQFYDDVQSTFGDSESFVNSFRNDLISMIYQNALKDFDIRNIKSYKGQLIIDTNVKEAATTVEQLSYLGIGVFVKDGTIYLDKKTLANQFDKSLYATEAYENLGLAKVSLDTFDSANEYFHFVFEREYLRNMYKNVSSLENNPEFQALYQNLLSDLQKNDLKKRELVKVSRPIKKVAKANPLTEAGVKPTDMYGNAAKDIQMAEEATQFIGFGTIMKEGNVSSTDKYAKAWGNKANTGKYTSSDVVMVSGSGNFGRGGVDKQVEAEAIRKTLSDKYKSLLDEAIKAGASFRVGNQYAKGNLSDQLIAEYLQKKGYVEEKLDGYSRWASPTGVKIVSPEYGVVQTETNPTEEDTQEIVNLIAPQIQKQAYKENVGDNANWQFSFGKMWSRVNLKAKPLLINSFAGVNKVQQQIENLKKEGKIVDKKKFIYDYHELDQDGNPLPSIKELQPLIDQIQNALGIDMSDYDSVLGNIYLDNQSIQPHKDTTESKSAEGYPVVVYTIGNNSSLGIWDDAKGKMTFQGAYKEDYSGKKPTNEVLTKNGSVYTFGMDGKGRFNLTHTTPLGNVKEKPYPPITLSDGRVITNYTITLTFRRAGDLEPGMPSKPAKLNVKQPAVEPLVEPTEDSYEVTEEAQKIYSALGNKTIAGKVVLKPLSELSNKGGILPDGNINALRNSKSNEHFGNPYDNKDTSGTIRTASTKESVERFINWVLNGDFVKQSRKVNDQDIAMFNSYVAKSKKLPTEFFTTNSTFKEFYNNETGRREKAPQTSLWMINDNNRYDLIDQVTGEVYISDVDLRNGYQYEEVQPARRQWIRNQLKSGELKNKDILYYTELNEPSHATALDYLINKYDWDIADPINKVKKEAFETFLRDKALTNIYNNAALFKGDNTFADKLNIIKTKFAEDDLLEKYPVLKVLGTNTTIVNKKDRYSNIQLIGNLNDTEELNSFYEQMLDLQNPTVKKVEDPEANKFISEFFTKLTHVAFLQSGLNTNTKFSFTRLMPQDGYIRLMEKPVKDATQNLSYNFLESYYKMFVSQNSITRKAIKDRFKDYVKKPTYTNIITPTMSREEAESMITRQPSGGMVYKASKIMNAQYAQELLSENSDLIFVYPDAFLDKSTAIGGKNDQAFKNLPQSNKIGSPDARYSINNTTVSSLIKDENGGPNKEIVDKIDEMVKAIEDSGKIPIFSSNGYGQAWISNVPEDAKSQPVIDAIRTKYTAPQTFLYLSKVLYEKFGYVNKNYDRTTAGKKVIQSKQPISDEQVLEFMRKCYLS